MLVLFACIQFQEKCLTKVKDGLVVIYESRLFSSKVQLLLQAIFLRKKKIAEVKLEFKKYGWALKCLLTLYMVRMDTSLDCCYCCCARGIFEFVTGIRSVCLSEFWDLWWNFEQICDFLCYKLVNYHLSLKVYSYCQKFYALLFYYTIRLSMELWVYHIEFGKAPYSKLKVHYTCVCACIWFDREPLFNWRENPNFNHNNLDHLISITLCFIS